MTYNFFLNGYAGAYGNPQLNLYDQNGYLQQVIRATDGSSAVSARTVRAAGMTRASASRGCGSRTGMGSHLGNSLEMTNDSGK